MTEVEWILHRGMWCAKIPTDHKLVSGDTVDLPDKDGRNRVYMLTKCVRVLTDAQHQIWDVKRYRARRRGGKPKIVRRL